MRPPVTYQASLVDLILFADASRQILDGLKCYLPAADYDRLGRAAGRVGCGADLQG